MQAQAQVEGLDETLRLLRTLGKEANKELRAEVQAMTEKHAKALQQAGGRAADPRVRHVSTTVRAAKDRLPTVRIGTAKRFAGRGGARATDLVYGTEFGAGGSSWWRFEPGPEPWIFPTLSQRHREVVADWETAVGKIVDRWAD